MDIKLAKHDKRYIDNTADVYSIMQRVLLRENKIDQEKEHFWMIGLDQAGYILYIELIALGTVKSVPVEPMNIYRVAVMKNASRVIAIHNHPSGRLIPSEADKDITDRLIQVGRILNITFVDHLIISPISYISFKADGLMDELENSVKYVPNYLLVEQIRKEEKKIAKEKLELEKDKTKDAKEKARIEKEQRLIEQERREKLELAMVTALLDKDVSIEDIAKIMDMAPKQVQKIIKTD